MSDVSIKFGAEDVGLEKTLKSVQAELGDLQDKVKSGDLSMTDLERSMRRVGQLESLEKRLEGMGNEAGQTTPKVDSLGKEMKQMGNEASVAGDKGGLSFSKLAAASVVGGLAVAGFVKVMSVAMDGARMVADKFGEALDMGGRLSDLNARTGETAGNLLILERAFDNAGAGADKVGPSINKLQKFMEESEQGITANRATLDRLGLSYEDLEGKLPLEQMKILAERISALPDPAVRATAAMQIFGRSGGELLPLLRNFSGEVENASVELGSLPKIMDENSERFDTISDKIQVLKGKFTEFAAGIIERVLPAIELFTISFSRIDAAGLGQKLADAFIGGQQAMKGFSAALDAIKLGEFGQAFKIAFMSIELQLKQTANEIVKNLKAAFSASADFLMEILGPSSGAYFALKLTFENIGKIISISISEGVAGAVGNMGAFGEKLAAGIRQNVEVMRRSIDINSDMISVAMGRITEDLSEAGKRFPKAFKDAYDEAQPLFDVTQDTEDLAAKIDEISKMKIISDESNDSIKRAGEEFLELQNAINPLEQEFGEVEVAADGATGSVFQLNQAIKVLPAQKEVRVEAKIDNAKQFEQDVKNLLDVLNAAPNQKIVRMAIDAGNFKDLAALKKEVEIFPEFKSVQIVLEKLGISLEDLKTAINGLPEEKRSQIAMDVLGIPDLNEARNLLTSLNPKTVEALCKVFGVEDVEELSSAIRGIPDPKLVEAVFKTTGTSEVTEAINELDRISTKERKALLEMSGKKSIDDIQEALAGIPDGKSIKQALEITGLSDVEQLRSAVDMLKDQQINIKIDPAAAMAELTNIEAKIAEIGSDTPLNLNAESSIQAIRTAIQQPIKLDLSGGDSSGGGVSKILTEIKSIISNIEGKLPMHALGA